MKRLIVYFHYDPLGQIDTACRVARETMAIMARCSLSPTARCADDHCLGESVVTLTCRERENKGLDVGAYKEALAVIGREPLGPLRQVLMNFTLAGPVCSLASMFAAMEARPGRR